VQGKRFHAHFSSIPMLDEDPASVATERLYQPDLTVVAVQLAAIPPNFQVWKAEKALAAKSLWLPGVGHFLHVFYAQIPAYQPGGLSSSLDTSYRDSGL
jgi:hypothetical protein